MNTELLKKKIKRLIEFLETLPGYKTQTFLNNDYKKILLDLLFLTTNTPGSIDTNGVSGKLKFKGGTSFSFKNELREAIQKVSAIEKVSNEALVEILKLYLECLRNIDDEFIPNEKWVEMSGRFYTLEMERLS